MTLTTQKPMKGVEVRVQDRSELPMKSKSFTVYDSTGEIPDVNEIATFLQRCLDNKAWIEDGLKKR